MSEPSPISLFLCGDVMTGRGIDQALPTPSDPTLHEEYITDARRYVDLAETVNGPFPRPVGHGYIWGDALEELQRAKVDLRIINLETSITRSDKHWPGKGIHYRMHPRNVGCLTAAKIDCCSLANNHVLDWGYAGLTETLETLDQAGIAHTGAGQNAAEAARPAVLKVPGKGQVLVFSYGLPTSGIPLDWAATRERPGVNLLEDTSEATARRIAKEMSEYRRDGDVIVASIHWGGNWGYHIREQEIRFAHVLVESGVSIVHGHSSHHVKAAEIYREGLVLYGCGDFINDYEGISGFESFRSDLTFIYLATVDPRQGRLAEAKLVPMRVARFRLNRATESEAKWLHELMSRLGGPLGTSVEPAPDGSLVLRKSAV